jgi:hypothetical protein
VGSEGSARLLAAVADSRGRPSSLPVAADGPRPSQQQRKIGVAAIDRVKSGGNNNSSLAVSDLSDMSSESDNEFPQVLEAAGETEGGDRPLANQYRDC